MKPLTREWVSKAEGDHRVVSVLRRAKRPVYDAICYHSQQCAEKYLKGWLIEQGIRVPKIHDLESLAKSCATSLPELVPQLRDAIYLTTFAIEIRYPGTTASKSDAVLCWKAMRVIRKIVRKQLGL